MAKHISTKVYDTKEIYLGHGVYMDDLIQIKPDAEHKYAGKVLAVWYMETSPEGVKFGGPIKTKNSIIPCTIYIPIEMLEMPNV